MSLSEEEGGLSGNQPKRKISLALTPSQVGLVRSGSDHAQALGLPLNRFITINWSLAGVIDVQAAQAGFLKRFRDWVRSRGQSTAFLWVLENGRAKGVHTHLVAHVPAQLARDMANVQRGWLKAVNAKSTKGLIYTRPIGHSYNACQSLDPVTLADYQTNLAVLLEYLQKAADDEARAQFNICRIPQRGEVIGKRAGTSRNIGASAIKRWNRLGS